MPIYEYRCEKCNDVFEKMVLSKNSNTSCPKCGNKEVEKILSVFSSPASSNSDQCNPNRCGVEPGPNGVPPCASSGGCGMMG